MAPRGASFLDLPPEIRFMIYSLATKRVPNLFSDKAHPLISWAPPSILQVSPLVMKELVGQSWDRMSLELNLFINEMPKGKLFHNDGRLKETALDFYMSQEASNLLNDNAIEFEWFKLRIKVFNVCCVALTILPSGLIKSSPLKIKDRTCFRDADHSKALCAEIRSSIDARAGSGFSAAELRLALDFFVKHFDKKKRCAGCHPPSWSQEAIRTKRNETEADDRGGVI